MKSEALPKHLTMFRWCQEKAKWGKLMRTAPMVKVETLGRMDSQSLSHSMATRHSLLYMLE